MRRSIVALAAVLGLALGGCSFMAYDLPPESKEYRYTMKQFRGGATVNTAWTFWSKQVTVDDQSPNYPCVLTYAGQGVPCKPESAIFLRYDLGVALDNTVQGGRSHKITVTPFYQDLTSPPKVTSLTVEMTLDGTRWRKAPVRPAGAAYTATLQLPKTGVVGLRVLAKDNSGATVNQTIDKAFRLS
ncbi:hypothetical protein [Tenggerimyces flavus]|uniref:Lipoprotein n=1 Tax=Tenggerimyces flavus TaxID=1708749 RepID=A0ABV7YN69_9ACTN|nr:hypothetical protein [Tenggerimyces flavus]MBM7786411.1 hypothetical protein [Tenggerimyces flavus]